MWTLIFIITTPQLITREVFPDQLETYRDCRNYGKDAREQHANLIFQKYPDIVDFDISCVQDIN